MRNAILLSIGLLVMACGSTKVDESVTLQSEDAVKFDRSLMQIPQKPSDIGIAEAAAGVQGQFTNAGKIGDIMNFLASDELEGRDTGSEGIEKAADFIENVTLLTCSC